MPDDLAWLPDEIATELTRQITIDRTGQYVIHVPDPFDLLRHKREEREREAALTTARARVLAARKHRWVFASTFVALAVGAQLTGLVPFYIVGTLDGLAALFWVVQARRAARHLAALEPPPAKLLKDGVVNVD